MRINIGSRGTRVRALQQQLNGHGYPVKVDAVFGPMTQQAVEQFQAGQGLVVDGVVGRITWAALAELPRAEIDRKKVPVIDGLPGRAVLAARADLGAAEQPDGANSGRQIAHLVDGYNDYWKINDGRRYPWCAMAVSVWIARALDMAGKGKDIDWTKHPFGAWFGGVSQIEEWAKANNRWSTDLSDLVPGAVYTMGREGSSSDAASSTKAGHTGIVVEVLEGGMVRTIDGNASNRVSLRERPMSSLRGWVRWWDEAKPKRTRKKKAAPQEDAAE